MDIKLSPHIIFNGNCSEAMNFYNNVFDGELIMKTYSETSEKISENDKDKIMHALLSFNNIEITASDALDNNKTVNCSSVIISLEYDNINEAENIFNKLSEGSLSELVFKYSFWGTKFGLFTDKFGIQWMITI